MQISHWRDRNIGEIAGLRGSEKDDQFATVVDTERKTDKDGERRRK